LRDGKKPQIPPLRCAPVGMTKGRGVTQVGAVAGWEETAGPSTTLRSGRDDKGSGVALVGVVAGWGETAGPSTTLRFGRDDKGKRGWLRLEWLRDGKKLQIPPLRCAPVGMTKGRGVAQVGVVAGGGETADPSTSLRSGRDDKGSGVTQVGVVSGMGRNRRSLHYSEVEVWRYAGNTKGRE